MNQFRIEDDFLSTENFEELRYYMGLGDHDEHGGRPEFAWIFNEHPTWTTNDDRYKKTDPGKDVMQFSHVCYMNHNVRSNFFDRLWSIMEKLNPIAIWRIKANLIPRTNTITNTGWHLDIGNLENSPEKLGQWTNSIFYINTCNGYTKFEDGRTVESVANRLLTFPSDITHTGTSCTDEKARIVINFNYFSSR